MNKNISSKKSTFLSKKYRNWTVKSCIYFSENTQIFSIQSPNENINLILKIISKRYFNKSIYLKIHHFSDQNLCVPIDYIHKNQEIYLFYPQFTTLESQVINNGLSLSMILQLGIDLCHAADYLIQSNYFSIDIHPGNIYWNNENKYLLGDLSLFSDTPLEFSPKYISPELLALSKEHHSIKRPSSVFYSYSIQYTICLLIMTCCNNGNIPSEDSPPIISEKLFYLLQKGTSKKPEARFNSIKELRESLESLLQEKSIKENQYQFHLADSSHSFFQNHTHLSKQISRSQKSNFNALTHFQSLLAHYCHSQQLFFLILWCFLIIVGSVFLNLFYHFLHPKPNEALADLSPNTSIVLNHESEWNIEKKNIDSFTALTDIPNDQTTISCIYAGQNSLKTLEGIPSCPNLQEIYLNDNQLCDIKGIEFFADLEILVLSQNHLTDLSCLTSLKKLSYLDISSNKNLQDENSLTSLSQLNTLVLTNTNYTRNQISELQKNMPNCKIISSYSYTY